MKFDVFSKLQLKISKQLYFEMKDEHVVNDEMWGKKSKYERKKNVKSSQGKNTVQNDHKMFFISKNHMNVWFSYKIFFSMVIIAKPVGIVI